MSQSTSPCKPYAAPRKHRWEEDWYMTTSTKLIFASFCCHVATLVDNQLVNGGNNRIFLWYFLKNATFEPFLGVQTFIFIPFLSIENEEEAFFMPLSYRYEQSLFAEYNHSTNEIASRNEMLAFHEWNASKLEMKCLHSMSEMQVNWKWNASHLYMN